MKISKRKIGYKLLICVITYLFIELICLIFISAGYIPAPKPTFKFIYENTVKAPFASVSSVWGNWHIPGKLQYEDGCISFNYFINSAGARDKERELKSSDTNRVIVLGDSFIEGWGVDASERVSDILEKKTNRAFLNFGCATFGLTQELLLYKNLAANYDHSTVLIGFLPYNDFSDDDLAIDKNANFYKPYFIKTDSGFQLTYHGVLPVRSSPGTDSSAWSAPGSSWKEITVRFLKSYTYWYNIYSHIKLKNRENKEIKNKSGKTPSYYFDFTQEQFLRLEHVLTQLRAVSGKKRIILFSIPLVQDLERIRRENDRPPLVQKLESLCKNLEIEYLDIGPYAPNEKIYRDNFFYCDPHWNEKGNRFAAEILYKNFFTFTPSK
ncbi:MAG: hypothetical protein ACXWV8_04620 [Chitinophagaceae bacterium]